MSLEQQLRDCARVAGHGRHVAFLTNDPRYARDRHASLVTAKAAGKDRLFFGSGVVRFCDAKHASFALTGFHGFVVIDCRLALSQGLMRELRDLQDSCAMMFPEGEFERLCAIEVAS